MTNAEREVLDLAIKWRESKYAIEEAIIRQQFVRAIDMLRKERGGNEKAERRLVDDGTGG